MTRRAQLLSVIALLAPSLARADNRELFTAFEVAPYVFHLDEPVRGGPKATKTGYEATAMAFYGIGILNSVHVGGAIHYATAKNAEFKNATLVIPDGSVSTGSVWEDVSALSATALVNYRLNLGGPIVTTLQLEGGLASLSYSRIGLTPHSQTYSIPFKDESEMRPEFRVSLRADYRFAEHFLAGAGLGYVVHPSAMNPSSLYVPVYVGYRW